MAPMARQPAHAAAERKFRFNQAIATGMGSTDRRSPFFALRRAAGKLFHLKAQHREGGKVGHYPHQHDRHQAQQTIWHGAQRPVRHYVEHPHQRGRHYQHRNHQTQQEARPARLRGKDLLLTQLPVEQPGVETGRQTDG